MDIVTCERTLTKEGKVSYCRNQAFYISTQGHYTGVIIKVCERCKQKMISVESNGYKSQDFQRIGAAPVSKVDGKVVERA